jgi:dTDP-6-deoxy-L-talose 4-dehydrogenase (NAD+)
MAKKVLVTGASGFIGNYVITELLKQNYIVIATSTNPNKIIDKEWAGQVRYIPFDFKKYNSAVNYFTFFHQPDLMIHLAWEGLPNYKSLFHFEENLPRHYAFIKNLIVNGLKDLTVTGTCLEYGFLQGCLSENLRTSPSNAYGLAKDSLQKFLSQLQLLQQFSFKWTRLFYLYGRGQSPNSIFSQLEKAISEGEEVFNMSGGEQVRDYLTVEEVATNIIAIATQQEVSGTINCCSGAPVRLKDLVEKYLKEKGYSIKLNLGYYPYLDYEPMEFWGDNTRLNTILSNEKSN